MKFHRLCIFLSLASATFAAPLLAAERISHDIYTVSAANDEWTSTHITAAPGDILFIDEPGNKVVVGAFIGSTDANGQPSGIGALMMKIGAGAQLKTGRHNAIVATDTGVVKFRVYDKKYVDNSGSYKVSIIRIPAALIPPAQNVE